MRDIMLSALPQRDDEDPAVLVLREDDHQYVVHVRVTPEDREPFHVWGHYFPFGPTTNGAEREQALDEALDCFLARCETHKALLYEVAANAESGRRVA